MLYNEPSVKGNLDEISRWKNTALSLCKQIKEKNGNEKILGKTLIRDSTVYKGLRLGIGWANIN